MPKYKVITDNEVFDFDDHDSAYKFYCDNIIYNDYIELAEIHGIVGRTLLYHIA